MPSVTVPTSKPTLPSLALARRRPCCVASGPKMLFLNRDSLRAESWFVKLWLTNAPHQRRRVTRHNLNLPLRQHTCSLSERHSARQLGPGSCGKPSQGHMLQPLVATDRASVELIQVSVSAQGLP